MFLTHFFAQNFRNILETQLDFSPEFNFIIGENGSGKTNFLEAIFMLGHGKSYRTLQTQQIIRYNENEFVLFGKLTNEQNTVQIGLSKTKNNEKRIRINGEDKARLAELAKLLPIQFISPDGFSLITGGPKLRRTFLDWGSFHHFPTFFSAWNLYKRLLKQRNAALKNIKHYQELTLWDEHFVKLSLQINQMRNEYFEQILPYLIDFCAYFLPEFKFTFKYFAGFDAKIDLKNQLKKQFERDRFLGFSNIGPHKMDFHLFANGVLIENHLSRGQIKLVLCALKLAQGAFYSKQNEQKCLFLIDDISSELDESKKMLLFNMLRKINAQVLISAIKQTQITQFTQANDKIFFVNCGKINQVSINK